MKLSIALSTLVLTLMTVSAESAYAQQCPFAGMEPEISQAGSTARAEATYPASPDPNSPSGVLPPEPAELAAVHNTAKANAYNDMVAEYMLNEAPMCRQRPGGTVVVPNAISMIYPGGETYYTPDSANLFEGLLDLHIQQTPGGGWAILGGPILGCSAELGDIMGTKVWRVSCSVNAMAQFWCCFNSAPEGGEGGEGGGGAGGEAGGGGGGYPGSGGYGGGYYY